MTDIREEEWLPVAWSEGRYEVSSLGRVRRLPDPERYNFRAGGMLPQGVAGDGYLSVGMTTTTTQRRLYVHRLVAEAFCGPCPPGHQVNHKDGNKRNNHKDNLEWVTPSQNCIHRFYTLGKNNLDPLRGEDNPNATLTAHDAARLYDRYLTTADKSWIGDEAQKLGVTKGCILHVVNGRAWRSVTRAPRPVSVKAHRLVGAAETHKETDNG